MHSELSKTKLELTSEQQHVLDRFGRWESMRIDAYAGSGKTTTLAVLAKSTNRTGLYLAFNRSIANEAAGRFPNQVRASTAHSLAYRQLIKTRKFNESKLTGALTPNLVASALRFPQTITFASGVALTGLAYAALLLSALRHYLQSAASIPSLEHFELSGLLGTLAPHLAQGLCAQALDHLKGLWALMQDPSTLIPLTHDGYLKLWALSKPKATVDYIMVDEAQDLNPVLLEVLSRQTCPVTYVGDPFQQIYEWRGAVNALEKVNVKSQALLSQSFRFGSAIATAATQIIMTLGAKTPVSGLLGKASFVGPTEANVILSRTNVGVITNVLETLRSGRTCHVLGGTKSLYRLLEDVQRIKSRAGAITEELIGFKSWKDVVSFAHQEEGAHLRPLVTTVKEFGESQILSALARTVATETEAQIVCSTVHRAKGREWRNVRLDDDFTEALINSNRRTQKEMQAEARLIYVGVTRATTSIQIPAHIVAHYKIHETSRAEADLPLKIQEAEETKSDGVLSPYHSAKAGDDREMATLRRILRG